MVSADEGRSGLPPLRRVPVTAAAEVPLAALAGLALGLAAGPPGMIAGALLGGVAGLLLALALWRKQHRDAESEDVYDEELGVTSGTVGAPNLQHPPARIGAYSAESMGASAWTPAEPVAGPIPLADA
jgi:hypothetical protein